ncbi:serine/threonine-protein kinase-like protein At3g51990 [Phalaenopsis equestris]|uniref:serine/threonine-protein kinase-like protein At3g51990 n=1 Tax=Phalaenopsis equestris TaxID=78828 RepID=UPI0009E3D3EA|nr:serine/threonine-protein kinase-like protein At3g51990 [Phalaenopsis equestris]
MGYLSCRADSSIATCRSISSFSPAQSQRRKPKNARSSSAAEPGDAENNEKGEVAGATSLSHPRIRNFSYRELESATQNFAEAALLGRGSHGAVYKAVLRSGRSVAVKRPSRRPIPSPAHEVDNEIEILSHIQNPRLVNLVGFTPPGGKKERLLVVEFMPNGTLYDLLHSNHRPPGWARRLRLALQTAKAILALHCSHPPIIHRDVKSANVLLDERFNARLGDFGLALKSDGDENEAGGFNSSVRSTPPAGTLGYLDPGYITPENLSTKTDVFSFGILLLEIISGRKAIDVSHSPPSVVDWAVPLLKKGKILAIFDPRITPPRDPLARRQLALLASSCVRSCRDRRPTMVEIVEQLKILNRTVPARVWTVSAPCSVIDTESTLVKLRFDRRKEREENPARTKKSPASFSSCSSSPPPPSSTLPPLRMVKSAANGVVAIGVDRNNELLNSRSRRLHVVPATSEDDVMLNPRRNQIVRELEPEKE